MAGPLARSSVTAIPLGRLLRGASSNQPGRRPGDRLGCRHPCRPYSVLLPAGLAVPLPLPVARCALTAPFHPYLQPVPRRGGREAVCFLWRFPWGRPRRTLSGAVSPWSPDFPLPRGSGRPADWRISHSDRRRPTQGNPSTTIAAVSPFCRRVWMADWRSINGRPTGAVVQCDVRRRTFQRATWF